MFIGAPAQAASKRIAGRPEDREVLLVCAALWCSVPTGLLTSSLHLDHTLEQVSDVPQGPSSGHSYIGTPGAGLLNRNQDVWVMRVCCCLQISEGSWREQGP